MNVLITGGAGYLGTELAIKLSGKEEVSTIYIYDNLSRINYNFFFYPNSTKKKFKFIHGDILDSRKLDKILENVDVVYHLAARVITPFTDESPHLFEQVNHWGTAELAYSIERSNVKKVIYISSTSVYGSSDKMVSTETPPTPRTFYGISKLRGEEYISRLNKKGINTWIIRSGNIYGYSPSMRFDSVINKFIFEAHFKKRIRIHGTGEQTRSFISVNRASSMLANILSSVLPGGLYNMVDHDWSVNYIAMTLKSMYPDLDMLYINQHLKLRELKVSPDSRINQICDVPAIGLKEDIEVFQVSFAF